MPENPYQPPHDSREQKDQPKEVSPAVAAYNVVSDVVGGVNVRWSDNKFQAVFVGISVVVAAVVGAIVSLLVPSWELPWVLGAVAGAFGGLVFGIFASGIYLMIYRAIRHIKGKHE